MAFTPSPEQTKVREIKTGGAIVVANAGTGKTTTSSYHVVDCYLYEERRLFPHAKEHVSGKDQFKILRQFLLVTFTVKAAAGLDEKVKELFAENGIPIPTSANGQPFRLARTLDSFLQSWLMAPKVFQSWMDTDTDTKDRLLAILESLPENIRAQIEDDGNTLLYSFSRRWSWLVDADVTAMLLDLIIRHEEGVPLEGCDVEAWAYEFNQYLATMQIDARGRFISDFWSDRVNKWKQHQNHFADLDHALQQAKPVPDNDVDRAMAIVHTWENLKAKREEFLSVYELARARGYHPVYAPERIVARSIEDLLSSAIHIKGYQELMRIAEKWHKIKTHFLVREFGDQTTAFVHAVETFPALMQRDVEYPWIVRRKNVFWDEVQDNSDFQHRILKLFYAKKGIPFLTMAIGDPKQQIYCWRGASPRGFSDMIEKKRASDPGRLLGLTCSYRSAQRIVALGNEVIQTLPSYRERVLPSTTIYQEEGEVHVSRPFNSQDEEAQWVQSQIEHYLVAHPELNIMVVSRTDISDHPLNINYLSKHPELNSRVSALTIHKSKGLEADIVFVLGLVAGKMPDVRAHPDEEVNLAYVAFTRAKRILLISGLLSKRDVNEAGRVDDIRVGPSPYFAKLPTLRALCLANGWTEKILREGLDTHGQLVAAYLSVIEKKRTEIIQERLLLFPKVAVLVDDKGGTDDIGALAPDPSMIAIPRQTMTTEEISKEQGKAHMVHARLRDRVQKKMTEGYRMKGRLPNMQSDEFNVALRSGWIRQEAGSKRWDFSKTFLDMITASQAQGEQAVSAANT